MVREAAFVGLGASFEICAPENEAVEAEAAEAEARSILDEVPMVDLH